MKISQEHIDKLKKIHKKKYNEDLTDEEAREHISTLAGVFNWLTKNKKPDTDEKADQY